MRLVERDHLLEPLAELLAQSRDGRGACVFIGGEAGVGKTALLRHVVESLPRDVTMLWGISDALQTPSPLAALHDMISQLDAPTRQRLGTTSDRFELFASFFAAVADRPSAVLVFEDVHWADDATLDLLRYIARRVRRARLLVIASFRDDALGALHPLRIVLGDLATSGIKRLSIAPLTVDGVQALAADPRIDAGALHRRTGGNPFFVSEVLAGPDEALPATVRDAVLARVLRAAAEPRAVLSLAAIVPGLAERWLIEALLPGSDAAIVQCLAEGLLVTQDGAVGFRHEIARQAVEQWLEPATARALHGRVLSLLEARTPGALARLVHHAARAGADVALVRHALPAARQAALAGAHRGAAAHYAQALASSAVPDDATRAAWLEAQAYELYLVGEIRAAMDCREAVLAHWQAQGDRSASGRNLRWLSRLRWMSGDKQRADLHALQAVQALEAGDSPQELAMAYSNLAQLHMLAENAAEATSWGERAIALAESSGAIEPLVHALNNVGNARAFVGDSRGLPLLERSLRLALQHGMEEHAARAYCNLANGAVVRRDYARAEPLLESGIAYCGDRGLESWSVYLTAWRSRAHFEQGRWSEATNDAHDVISRTSLGTIWRIPALTVVGALRVRRGDPGAAEMLDEVQRITLQTGELQRVWPMAVARAEAAWLAGDLSRCRDEASVGFRLAMARHSGWAAGETALWMWRAGALTDRPAHCAEPYALQIGGDWQAAARAWRALGCPYEEAGALADGDEAAQHQALVIYEHLGARPAARRLRDSMRAQGRHGVPRGPRSSTQANAFGLTTREQEILALLDQGLSNQQIAGSVHRSVRTIDHHVAAVLGKLGASSRVEAVERARRHGLLAAG